MRAVRSSGADVAVVDVDAPHGPGVRVGIRSAGICGSDLEMVRTGFAAATLGHEFAGVLDDGTAVAVHPFVPCGGCDECRAACPQLCRAMGATMLGVFADGGMADEVRVDPSCLSPLPDEVPVDDASLVEPVAVALHACNRAGVEAGMRVGVVGAGTIGLLSAAVACDLGADVHLVARHAAQHAAAEQLGVPADGARNCDVVIEAAGSPSAFDDAVRGARRRGTVVLVSTTWEPIAISFLNAQMRETSIVPAFMYGHAHGAREFDAAATILAAHPEIGRAVITHRFPLDDAARAFTVAADRAHGAIKVVLHP